MAGLTDTGLRLSELRHLRAADIDSHAERRCMRVEQGKGGKDRRVPLADDVLEKRRAGDRCDGHGPLHARCKALSQGQARGLLRHPRQSAPPETR